MIQEPNSYLFLKRLVVTKHLGGIAYDEEFHTGVNIIRGKNSSGKSTISNLIYYALGGDYNSWNGESLRCHEVFAQVEINGATLTLKRQITTSIRQPMSIFWGNYEESRKDASGWKTFGYNQYDERVSFSNILFNALSFPEVRNEEDRNINMSQVLRLLYVDQDSPTQKFFRFENFDYPLTRQAISELLLGVYDDNLYSDRIDVKKKNKEKDEKEKELKSQQQVLSNAGAAINIAELNNRISGVNGEIAKVNQDLAEARAAAKIRIAVNSRMNIEQLQTELQEKKEAHTNLNEQIFELDNDIVDSRQFIAMLEGRIGELAKSMSVRRSLGQLSLTYCPECLLPLDNHGIDTSCFLCKKELPQDEARTHAKRLKQELELQVKESSMLLGRKEITIAGMRSALSEAKQALVTAQRNLDNAIATSQSSRDDLIDSLLIRKGGLERQIDFLNAQLTGLNKLEALRQEVLRLTTEIKAITLRIGEKEAIQKRSITDAMNQIEKIAIWLVQNDLDRQKEFKSPKRIKIDFLNDSISLDESFNFSASSNVYLKNSGRFAIFFASIVKQFMRFPRLIFCDNMEDKGMEKERTQNFQKLIVRLSEQYKHVPHQIIFSTSMIADELEGSVYCVGRFYDQDHKTLDV
ncbi:AAA family ATPase [Pedobacter gandavensis]|uniref:AAA family ATPase n=1 Tax=Pedobacter gandavensis TaxID=2679963 RepID=UPI0029312FC6|nr:AAA family ATPase [Pedobacter gandavensis]